MTDDLRNALLNLNLFRDWVEHLGLRLTPDGVETYKLDIINKLDELISTVANPDHKNLEPLKNDKVQVEDFTPKQLWIMAQKLNMDDFIQIVAELRELNSTPNQ